ncbi:hypothetical protein PMAYCL1PPCAC_26190, partial [Pristionchus mayeri]
LDIYPSIADSCFPFVELVFDDGVIIQELIVKGLRGFNNAEMHEIINLAYTHKSQKLVLASSVDSLSIIYNDYESCKLIE